MEGRNIFLNFSRFFIASSIACLPLMVNAADTDTDHVNVVKSANYRDVRAELTYQVRDEEIDHPRLKISKQGKVLFEELIKINDKVTFEDISLPIATDLDGDWEPEVIINLALNKKGQLNESVVFSLDKESSKYKFINHGWNTKTLVYDIQDVNEDGLPEFITYNVNFLSEFVDSTEDLLGPVKVWKLENDKFIDTTNEYNDFVYEYTVSVWNKFDQLRKAKEVDQSSIKAILASYIANKHSLGQSDDAWKRLRQVYTFKDSSEYFATLKTLLNDAGYSETEKTDN